MGGGRSTYGECLGVLSWVIREGHVDGVALDGLKVALATRYHDDEPGSPWSFVMYVDERGDEEQLRALEDIYTGRLGGDALEHFPWAWKASRLITVRPVEIEVSHEARRQWLRIRDHVTVRIRDAYAGDEAVTCVIPGHQQSGEELVADELRDRSFVLYSVDLQEDAQQVEAFQRQYGLNLYAVLDDNGDVTRAFGVRALPATFLIDQHGVVRQQRLGPLLAGGPDTTWSEAWLATQVRSLLAAS